MHAHARHRIHRDFCEGTELYLSIDAHMHRSVCGDLRISSIVDIPNWVVPFYFPRTVLE